MIVQCEYRLLRVKLRVLRGYLVFFFFQAEDGIRDLVRSRGLGDVYKRQRWNTAPSRFRQWPM